jgi:two-component system nitrogen regulation response regulator GlnG
LIESELFGHEKGSFTGATGQRLGKFELCDGGTIFLDEIGDMALATQTKILRVLQQGDIQRVGGTETIRVDVRILAATNKDLEDMVKAKTFREDLYYRLNVVRIRMPALRERGDDVPQIVDFCLQNLVKQRKARVSKVSPEAMAILVRYRWPGNVRELENVIYRSAVIAQGDAILVKNLPNEILEAAGAEGSGLPIEAIAVADTIPSTSTDSISLHENVLTLERVYDFLFAELTRGGKPMLSQIESALRMRALQASDGDVAQANRLLGAATKPTLVSETKAARKPATRTNKKSLS